eukprot:6656007-Heterocapsa_arctica.AAC.1
MAAAHRRPTSSARACHASPEDCPRGVPRSTGCPAPAGGGRSSPAERQRRKPAIPTPPRGPKPCSVRA